MGKKKAMMIFKGSLKTHWIKYITNFNMTINPTQHNAINQSYEFLKMFSSLESKFLQPGFTFKHEMMKNQGYNDPSFLHKTINFCKQQQQINVYILLHVKFVNGYERKYDMANQPFSFIKTEINYINQTQEMFGIYSLEEMKIIEKIFRILLQKIQKYLHEIKYYLCVFNDLVEFERTMAGQDDELEDEI